MSSNLLLVSVCLAILLAVSNAFNPAAAFCCDGWAMRKITARTALSSAASDDSQRNKCQSKQEKPIAKDNSLNNSKGGKRSANKDGGVGGYDPGDSLRQEEVNVGDPQIKVKEKERSVTSILKELAAIQQQGPQKYCILGTRHCSYLHQQIIELLYVGMIEFIT